MIDIYNRVPNMQDGTFTFMCDPTQQDLMDQVVEAIKTVYDPEIPIDVLTLGLIYSVEIENACCSVLMSLTSPMCPVAGELPVWVEDAVKTVDGVDSCDAEITFEPMFTPELMSEEAKLVTGMY